ncbi:hypothetical protein BC332_13073 [Capsicum chinense]|nr:hypothetical protein BC332_13073 [Capsicum chinense]
MLQAETENNRDDLFIFRLNGNLLHFGKRKFCVVTGLRSDKKSIFFSDFKAPNKFMPKYYHGIEKVKRSDFYTDFAMTENFFKEDDLYEIGMLYFIIRSSEDLIFNEYLKTTMFKRYSNEYQFKDIIFTDEEMVKYNLLAIHQDSFVQQEQNNFVHPDVDGEKNLSSNVKDEQIFDMKNELTNVIMFMYVQVLDEMSNNQKKNVSRSLDDLLQTPHGSKTCEEIPNEPINMKCELSRDMTSEKDEYGDIVGAKLIDNLSPLKKLSFFTVSQLIALEPTFRMLETSKFESQTLSPVIFDKSPVIMHQYYGSGHEKFIIYFKQKHPFKDYVGFEVPDILVDQFID